MAKVIDTTQWCWNPAMYFSVDYSYSRSGTDVNYTVTVNVWTTSSGAWYNNIISTILQIEIRRCANDENIESL